MSSRLGEDWAWMEFRLSVEKVAGSINEQPKKTPQPTANKRADVVQQRT